MSSKAKEPGRFVVSERSASCANETCLQKRTLHIGTRNSGGKEGSCNAHATRTGLQVHAYVARQASISIWPRRVHKF